MPSGSQVTPCPSRHDGQWRGGRIAQWSGRWKTRRGRPWSARPWSGRSGRNGQSGLTGAKGAGVQIEAWLSKAKRRMSKRGCDWLLSKGVCNGKATSRLNAHCHQLSRTSCNGGLATVVMSVFHAQAPQTRRDGQTDTHTYTQTTRS